MCLKCIISNGEVFQNLSWFEPQPPSFLKRRLTLPKIPRKGGWGGGGREKTLLKGRGILRRGDYVGNGGYCQSGYFPGWGEANVTTVTFVYILVIVFLFPLNVGVSPCFHHTVLVTVYRVHTSCFHNTVVSSCYRLHTSCWHHTRVTSSCSPNMQF